MQQKTLKICVGYHKPSLLLKGDCFLPVWGGKAVAGVLSKDGDGLTAEDIKWMEENCIGDDTGENISAKNRNYCEATILYWMWQNYEKLGNPDYIGFLQYRRHWVLNERYLSVHQPDFYNLIWNECFSNDYQYKIGLTEDSIYRELNDCDGIFCVNDTQKSIYSYKNEHHSQDIKYWDKTLEIIEKEHSKYAEAAKYYNEGSFHAWSNCFVMTRDDFFEYCEFLFDVLNKIDNFASIEYDTMTAEQMRVPAYVSETMLGIFWKYKELQGKKFKSYPLTYIKKPFESLSLLPKYIQPIDKDAIPIVFIADENYIRYTSVAIQSVIQNASDDNSYDIIILHDGNINKLIQERIISMHTKNVSIRFFNASYYISHYDFSTFFHKRLNLMPYLKLFIHEILKDYDKAIFLDGDLLVLNDIAELYNQTLNGKLIGAVKDFFIVDVKTDYWHHYRSYITLNQKMHNINNYFNSGVLLLNLELMRKTPELINGFLNEAKFKHRDRRYHDQDAMNIVLENNVLSLSTKYNYQLPLLLPVHLNNLSVKIKTELQLLLQSCSIMIMHYCGDPKPWQSQNYNNRLNDLWWQYARQTPFYEEILAKYISSVQAFIPLKQMLIDSFSYKKNRFKYYRYKILSKITFGKMRKKYKQKRKDMKVCLNNVREFIKGR